MQCNRSRCCLLHAWWLVGWWVRWHVRWSPETRQLLPGFVLQALTEAACLGLLCSINTSPPGSQLNGHICATSSRRKRSCALLLQSLACLFCQTRIIFLTALVPTDRGFRRSLVVGSGFLHCWPNNRQPRLVIPHGFSGSAQLCQHGKLQVSLGFFSFSQKAFHLFNRSFRLSSVAPFIGKTTEQSKLWTTFS